MKIRTITTGISLHSTKDEDKFRQSAEFYRKAKAIFEKAGYEVQTTRIEYALSEADTKLILWDVASEKALHTFKGHSATVNAACLSSYHLRGRREGGNSFWT